MKRIISMYSVITVMLLCTGCSHTSMMRLSPDEESYISMVNQFPLEFTVPKSETADVWGRAQSFIGKYSSMKLQNATDYIIQTYNPGGNDVAFGYSVTKTPLKNEDQITVQCNVGNMFASSDAHLNAHIFAYYIKTGELPYPRLINR
jgi:hypothetical protein